MAIVDFAFSLIQSKIARFSASSTSIAASSSSKQVSDRLVKLLVIDLDGLKREITGLSGQTLLKALANNDLIDQASHRLEETDACSSECEVNVFPEWLDKLLTRSTRGWDARDTDAGDAGDGGCRA